MSFPLAVSNDSISGVLSSISGCYDYVRWFDPLDSIDHWKSYVPGRAYNTLTHLTIGTGFWIGMTSPGNLSVIGAKPVTTSVTNVTMVATCWNRCWSDIRTKISSSPMNGDEPWGVWLMRRSSPTPGLPSSTSMNTP
jgi:hypothetical protein